MKKHIVILTIFTIAMALLVGISGCKKDSTKLTLSSITAGSIDLNLAYPEVNVPVNTTIIATFSSTLNPATVNSGNITMTRIYDNADIALTLTTAGSTVTIVPVEIMGNGSMYKLRFKSGITSSSGQSVGTLDRYFTTIGSFVPSGMIAYYNFENTTADAMGNYPPKVGGVIDVAYTSSYSTLAGKAGKFNGTSTLIEIPNGDLLELSTEFTVSFWVKADSSKHGQFVMGLAGWYGFQFELGSDYSWCKLAAQYSTDTIPASTSDDLYFPGDGKTKDNGGWKGCTFCKDLTGSGGVKYLLAAKWANVVCRFNGATKVATMFINGEKMKEQDYNLFDTPKTHFNGLKYNGVAGNNTFVFGFIQDKNNPTISDGWADYGNPANNHFKGLLDDVRFFHKSLTNMEIQMMYNSAKP